MRILSHVTRTIALLLAFVVAPQAMAQSGFSPAVTVDDKVITYYEIDQRARLLTAFRTPGAGPELAREQLIEERLKQAELDRAGFSLTEEGVLSAMEQFAERANLTLDQFLQVLSQQGVDRATLRDFVVSGISWRDYIRNRYGPSTQVSETDIDRAIAATTGAGAGIEVLLSEIIIPAPPPRAAQALARAQQIAGLRSQDAFSAAARQVSALPSRNNGGRLGWLPITNYPPQLRGLLLSLGTNEVTAPIQITNGVALFQMRGVREVPTAPPAPAAIEYAAYYIDSSAGLAGAQDVANRVDTCDDLYGIAQGQPAEVLERSSLAPAEIPQDVAIELARLDPGEVSYNLTRANGQTIVFLMLCNRVADTETEVDREAVQNRLRSQRLAGFAESLLENLRASATIVVR
ncbi:peptidylprolyl isomerase [Yoonia sp. 208BN28-4]|uniref:peptidylprolyl isomerase n=1 Tax=Yoonia sp. 208BN28-4 TaxID=3126505 RepID=UPI0030B684C8